MGCQHVTTKTLEEGFLSRFEQGTTRRSARIVHQDVDRSVGIQVGLHRARERRPIIEVRHDRMGGWCSGGQEFGQQGLEPVGATGQRTDLRPLLGQTESYCPTNARTGTAYKCATSSK